ncbi:histidine acid phosphatase [Colletotrichum orchidophilum]|uniref:Histidine acid phosphatase n=1 Tax=Colletotrichum orchidophilum TaxID=1209926 RepID=A0A1G4BE57_9PEZI|nr:histidine acid phosphatase [Colletotrichum orchidophilum]OHE99622.1 histidine acid phosphatase [Colletotrichum orchidophilum]
MAPITLGLLCLVATLVDGSSRLLAPAQDIYLPASKTAKHPLEHLGANGPWFAGPDVNGISSKIPENCYVDQTAYISRHGSRYPDPGAYNGWVSMQERFQAGNYTVSGSLSFLPRWKPVLTNPSSQIANLSPTGYKEAHDLGYTLRTRYPDLYTEGEDFMVWANNYSRVLQTAKLFVRGFLGTNATLLGDVVSVTSRGFVAGIGDSLAPSDMCPAFQDTEGGDYVTAWNDVYIPPILARLQALIKGNLTLTQSDVSQIPYLCGFESQITGRLSPWCDIFSDDEFLQYEYFQDLRYYYGVGIGTDIPKTMMTPYLNALMDIFAQGPSVTGKREDGSAFNLPKILVSFLNDGQLNELVAASGVFEEQQPLSNTQKDDGRLFVTSRFTTMRGTIAFERLNCAKPANGRNGNSTSVSQRSRPNRKSSCTQPSPPNHGSQNSTYIRIRLNDAVYPIPNCISGPGSSCPLEDYKQYVATKLETQGNWIQNCKVTTPGAPTQVKGASFYTDLSSPWLSHVAP